MHLMPACLKARQQLLADIPLRSSSRQLWAQTLTLLRDTHPALLSTSAALSAPLLHSSRTPMMHSRY